MRNWKESSNTAAFIGPSTASFNKPYVKWKYPAISMPRGGQKSVPCYPLDYGRWGSTWKPIFRNNLEALTFSSGEIVTLKCHAVVTFERECHVDLSH
eukprot:1330755-Amorphochlora_amoeboformis.AAC.2